MTVDEQMSVSALCRVAEKRAAEGQDRFHVITLGKYQVWSRLELTNAIAHDLSSLEVDVLHHI
jgi:hypothetical protein